MAVPSDAKYRAKATIEIKLFLESLPQIFHIWVFRKTFYSIIWRTDSVEPPSSNARKKAYDDEMTE